MGLTENPIAFLRWVIAGPEQAQLLTEFEDEYFTSDTSGTGKYSNTDTISATRHSRSSVNPFEDCSELLVINTRRCADESVVSIVRKMESLGLAQYESFKTAVFQDKTKSIHDAIKKNSLPLFKSPKPKKEDRTLRARAVMR